MTVLLTFILLQALDVASTLIAFSMGGLEANPLVRPFLAFGEVGGLLAAKAAVLTVGLLCWRYGKLSVIRKASWLYVAIVAWNVSVIAWSMFPPG